MQTKAPKYPFFEKFVREHMPTVTGKSQVFDAYVKWSQLGTNPAFMSLLWSTDPIVMVSDFPCETNRETGRSRLSAGMTWSKTKLGLAEAVVSRYDTAAMRAGASRNDRKTQLRFAEWRGYLEATLVHEMVHWGRKVRGVSAKTDEEEEKAAADFERAAYGEVVVAPEKLCFEIETYNAK